MHNTAEFNSEALGIQLSLILRREHNTADFKPLCIELPLGSDPHGKFRIEKFSDSIASQMNNIKTLTYRFHVHHHLKLIFWRMKQKSY
jgi:hypothetical protein